MKRASGLILVLGLIGLDQLIKYLAVDYTLFSVFINRGISFSLWPSGLWPAVTVVLILLMVFVFRRQNSLFLALFIAGSISNVIDRLLRGGVVDYVDIKIGPVFNLADLYLIMSILLLIYYYWSKPQYAASSSV